MVHFDQPWFELRIKHYIEAEQFETTIWLFLLTTAVDMLESRLDSKDCFYNDLLDILPNFLARSNRCFFVRFVWLLC